MDKLPDYGPSYTSDSDDASNIDDSELELKRKRDRRAKKAEGAKNRELPVELTGPYQQRWVLSASVLALRNPGPKSRVPNLTAEEEEAAAHAAAQATKGLSTDPSAERRREETTGDPTYAARRIAAPAAGVYCTRCWTKLVGDPRRKCEIPKKNLNCTLCKSDGNVLCKWVCPLLSCCSFAQAVTNN